MYQSDTYLKQAADRLLRLLMLRRINQVPLSVVDELRWDLGLPRNYVDSLVPHFPDYFRVKKAKASSSRSGGDVLELVCWIDDFAVSVMEKKAMKAGPRGYEKGMPIEFPVQHSRGFEMDKGMKKWISDWQKLPYISPYENARHLPSTSDESDRWAVAVMHELLHILVPKKTEKNSVLSIGDVMGIGSRLKRALRRHADIFYVSRKNMTRTVVLREAYKRGKLLEKHPMTNMRCRYAHLMKAMKEKHEANEKLGVSKNGEKEKAAESKSEAEADYTSDEEAEVDYYTRDEETESDYTSDEEADSADEEDGYEESHAVAHRGVAVRRGKTERGLRGASLKGAGLSVTLSQAKSDARYIHRTMDRAPFKDHRKSDKHAEQNFRSRSSIRSDFSRTREQSSSRRSNFPTMVGQSSSRRSDLTRSGRDSSSRRSDFTRSGGESFSRRSDFPRSKGHSSSRRSDFSRSVGQSSSRRSDFPRSGGRSSAGRSDFPRGGGRSSPNRRTFTE